jgi:hypothetical protein
MLDRRRSLVSTLALALALGGAFALATAPAAAGDTPPPPPPADHDAHHQQMAGRHAELMAKLTAMDAKVDGLLAAMNAASGQAKVDAIAAVVTELAAQRKELRDMAMEGIHAAMAAHGGGHDHGTAMDHHGMDHGELAGGCCKEGASCCTHGADCCGKAAEDCCAHMVGKSGQCSAAGAPIACADGKAMDCCAKHAAGETMACCAGKHGAGDAATPPPGH